jgi:hypothetical protein
MQSELPELARTRHHWIVLVQPPSKWASLGLLVLFFAAVFWPFPFLVIFLVVAVAGAALRWQTWRAELIILTRKRVLRVRGVPETTTSEASLRVDRISGARLVQTVPGKILDYGTIELEAPGDHPDVRHLVRIAAPIRFYDQLRTVIFASDRDPDPNDGGAAYITEPLPRGFLPRDEFPRDER